eukprot:366514-Chlamydomonas_euryale.AAC.4
MGGWGQREGAQEGRLGAEGRGAGRADGGRGKGRRTGGWGRGKGRRTGSWGQREGARRAALCERGKSEAKGVCAQLPAEEAAGAPHAKQHRQRMFGMPSNVRSAC